MSKNEFSQKCYYDVPEYSGDAYGSGKGCGGSGEARGVDSGRLRDPKVSRNITETNLENSFLMIFRFLRHF